VIGWLFIAVWMGALSAHRFILLSKYPDSKHRAASRAQAIALASIAVSFVLVAVGAPDTHAGLFFVVGGLISVVMLATMIARGIRPRRIRHAWRDIGDPEAWRGNRDLDA
jgi:uncharacterized membrane protein YfcA